MIKYKKSCKIKILTVKNTKNGIILIEVFQLKWRAEACSFRQARQVSLKFLLIYSLLNAISYIWRYDDDTEQVKTTSQMWYQWCTRQRDRSSLKPCCCDFPSMIHKPIHSKVRDRKQFCSNIFWTPLQKQMLFFLEAIVSCLAFFVPRINGNNYLHT